LAISNLGLIMIKLTNQNEKFLDQPFLINPKFIKTIFVAAKDDGGELVTYVYADDKEMWIVKETIDEILAQIKESK
jgi:uncharacterized protein YlzI (FlbEa/FlbD family)